MVILLKRKFDSLTVLAMCLCTALLTIVVMYAMVFFAIGGKEGLAFYNKLYSVKKLVEEKYVGELDWEYSSDVVSSAIVKSTGDRWSYYMTAKEYESYNQNSLNNMSGIGVTVQLDEEGRGALIISTVADAPADRAGLYENCIITSVAGQSIAGLSIYEVAQIIKFQFDEYALSYLTPDGEEINIKIKNEYIFSSPVSYVMLEDNIGYIRLENFERASAQTSISAMTELMDDGATGLIFDLRTNPGGQLSELTELLDYILPAGEIFISVDSEGNEEITYSEEGCVDIPIVVLINENTYSAAEFFAAALREYDAATIIGTPSTGKARSQQTYILEDGSAVHISTRNYLTPNRVNLADVGGLVPDIIVEAEEEKDAVLEKALEYLS